jgi:PPM family protein phosphatase
MKRFELNVKAASDLGLKRPRNEDSHAVWIPDEAEVRDQRGALIVVADGMGGSVSGEVASRLAVDTVVRVMSESPAEDLLADLRHAIEEANRVVHEKSLSEPELNGMGTTCTAVVIRGDVAWIGHVGDSRAYLIRGDQIRQLTHDHSLVARLVERRELTREQAKRDPRRNIVTRSIGTTEEVEVDTFKSDVKLRPGDLVLVCSDGLHGLLNDSELVDVVSSEEHTEACRQLIAEANDRGGHDNITVVLARVEESAEKAPRAARGKAAA